MMIAKARAANNVAGRLPFCPLGSVTELSAATGFGTSSSTDLVGRIDGTGTSDQPRPGIGIECDFRTNSDLIVHVGVNPETKSDDAWWRYLGLTFGSSSQLREGVLRAATTSNQADGPTCTATWSAGQNSLEVFVSIGSATTPTPCLNALRSALPKVVKSLAGS